MSEQKKIDENEVVEKENNPDEKIDENEVVEKENNPKETMDTQQETPEDKLKVAQEKILRLMAEIENQRRRFEKEKSDAYEYGSFNFALESLSLIDNIDRAIISLKNDESVKNNENFSKIIDNVEIVKKDIVSIFKKNQIQSIECINKKFDPNFHQAMLEVEDNTKEAGIVIQEVQKGYMMKDRLLRPSLVGVSKKVQKKD
jgi:molecular chaperone GrpE|tara:strand:+ start:3556 stop:4158 length:603 start_codon:yes stop_codon:yes gene_type:complete